MRADHQVALGDDQVVDRHDRQVQLQRLPVLAVVERDVEPRSVPAKSRPRCSGSSRMTRVKSSAGMPLVIFVQVFAVVVRLEEIRLVVVTLVARRGHVGRAGIVRRRLDDRDQRPVRRGLAGLTLSQVSPPSRVMLIRPSSEPAQMHAGLDRRLGDREDRRVGLGAGVVLGDRSAGGLHRLRVGARQVRADRVPALTLVGRCGRRGCRRGRARSGRAARGRSARSTGSGTSCRSAAEPSVISGQTLMPLVQPVLWS